MANHKGNQQRALPSSPPKSGHQRCLTVYKNMDSGNINHVVRRLETLVVEEYAAYEDYLGKALMLKRMSEDTFNGNPALSALLIEASRTFKRFAEEEQVHSNTFKDLLRRLGGSK